MDRKQKRKIVIKIGDILDNTCGHCEFQHKHKDSKSVCVTSCETGKELQRLGSLLEKKEDNDLSKPTQDIYESMKDEGKTDAAIANYFGITQGALGYHKKKWYKNQVKKKDTPKKEVTPMDIPEVEVNPLVEENRLLKEQIEELSSYNEQLKVDYEDAFKTISELRIQLSTLKNNEQKNEVTDYQNLLQALKPFLTISL